MSSRKLIGQLVVALAFQEEALYYDWLLAQVTPTRRYDWLMMKKVRFCLHITVDYFSSPPCGEITPTPLNSTRAVF